MTRIWLILISLALTIGAKAEAQQIGVGFAHSCALGKSGRAFCWGGNAFAQIGDGAGIGTTEAVSRPTEMAGGFVAISSGGIGSAGLGHSCGLQPGGTAFCWGSNDSGELGTGTNPNSSLPVAVNTNLKFEVISAGARHTCAIATDGTAWCWGANDLGQLGNLSQSSSPTPTKVVLSPPAALPLASISAGVAHSCAIDGGGHAFCWGNNDWGQIDASKVCQSPCNPEPFAFPLTFQSISAGGHVTCGITAGSVVCWGSTLLGVPTNVAAPFGPATVGGVTGAVSISAGIRSVCAVDGAGALFCWGDNLFGQLGNGSATGPGAFSVTPVRVGGVATYKQVSVGDEFACAVTTQGTVECWGDDGFGELGVGTVGGLSNVPLAISPFTSTWVTSGGEHACSLDSEGVTACWGNNHSGQVGHGHTGITGGTVPALSVVPTPVPRFGITWPAILHTSAPPLSQLSNSLPQQARRSLGRIVAVAFSQLAVGSNHNCVLDGGGHAYCWGSDAGGQIGNGPRSTAMCNNSVCVPAPTIVLPPTGVAFDQITAGESHNCASNNGIVFCWGDNAVGQLGAGVGPARRLPTRIKIPLRLQPTPLPRSMIETSAKADNTCGVDFFGEFFCWGFLVSSATPQQIISTAGLAQPFVKAQAGDLFACTGASGAPPACFGQNGFGQLGGGTNTSTSILEMMASPPLSSFSLGVGFGCGIDPAAGNVVCWGHNGAGQLGNGTVMDSNVPVIVQNSGSFGAMGVAAGQDSACAISAAGAVLCWGGNRTTPVLIAGGWNIQ